MTEKEIENEAGKVQEAREPGIMEAKRGHFLKEGIVNNIKYCIDREKDKDQKTPLGLDVGGSLQI